MTFLAWVLAVFFFLCWAKASSRADEAEKGAQSKTVKALEAIVRAENLLLVEHLELRETNLKLVSALHKLLPLLRQAKPISEVVDTTYREY